MPTGPPAVVYDVVLDARYADTFWRRVRKFRRGTGWALFVKVLVGLPLTAVLALVWSLHGPGIWLPRVTLTVVLLSLIFSARLDRWRYVRRFRKGKLADRTVCFTLRPEGLSVVAKLSTSTSQWAAFTAARRFPDGFLLIAGARPLYWLPHTALTTGTPEDAARVIYSGIPDYKDV